MTEADAIELCARLNERATDGVAYTVERHGRVADTVLGQFALDEAAALGGVSPFYVRRGIERGGAIPSGHAR